MTDPTGQDIDIFGTPATVNLQQLPRGEEPDNPWAYAPLEKVRAALASTDYDPNAIHFVRGAVEATIPGTVPGPIALLRLDTDWYASTKHELEHLYPLLSPGGVLLIDDYGHHAGARQATDEYFAAHPPILLARIDYTGRMGVRLR